MSVDQAVWILLFLAIVMANVPWILPNRLFIVVSMDKPKALWLSLVEWLVYLVSVGLVGIWLEYSTMGNIASQQWEFYVINLFLFMIFSFPGFIYRYNLKMFLDKAKK
ncbi:MAG: DUF2818 family protein [Thiomicrospira sp.]|uniref:DUF2818 family protein n=1 Tax=Thiomicrospira sp. TaxID=935 RepID=UPI001A085F38|nr:DUF2818 family protein [Thiomicrospira sp.]MBE0493385.1 DUF2818 family protein [Thiomicrospira sp.]